MKNKNTKTKLFFGFSPLNYTQVPDEFFDNVAPLLTEAQLKVMLYIIRRTFGFKKQSDRISLRQMLYGIVTKSGERLDQGVGVQKKALLKALNSLEESRYILRSRNKSNERGNEATTYSLNLVNLTPLGVQKTPTPRGSKDPTQETVEQETEKKSIKKKIENFSVLEAEVNEEQTLSANRLKRRVISSKDSSRAKGGLKKISEFLQVPPQKQPFISSLSIPPEESEMRLEESKPPVPDKYIMQINDPPQFASKDLKTRYTLEKLTTIAKEVSSEFADSAKEGKIITQMHRLYRTVQKRGMDEASFFDVVFTVRSLMRQERMYVTNQIAYFFTMLKDRLHVSVHSPP